MMHQPVNKAYEGIMSDEEITNQIESYERRFGMTSEEFLSLWEAGTAPDTFETNAWYVLLKYDIGDEYPDGDLQ